MSYARLDMTEFIDDTIPMPAAVSFKQLKVRSLMWPCVDKPTQVRPVLYMDGFATASGKAKMWVPSGAASDGTETGSNTLLATLGFAVFPLPYGHTQPAELRLSRIEPDPRLHINTKDAISDGHNRPGPRPYHPSAPQSDPVYAVSKVYDGVPQGTAFLAMSMEQSGTNAAVRSARHQITNDGTGTKKGVEITVELAPNVHMDALTPDERRGAGGRRISINQV